MRKEHIFFIALGVFALFSGYNIGTAIYQTYLVGVVAPASTTVAGG